MLTSPPFEDWVCSLRPTYPQGDEKNGVLVEVMQEQTSTESKGTLRALQ